MACRWNRMWLSFAVIVISGCLSATSRSAGRIEIDLHRYGFPPASNEPFLHIKVGLFYLSRDQVAVFFEQPILGSADPHNRTVRLLVFDKHGSELAAQLVLRGDPNALDITPGPDAGVL